MNANLQLTYSHGYFIKLPHTGADVIAHLLFVFAIHMIKEIDMKWKAIKLIPATFMTNPLYSTPEYGPELAINCGILVSLTGLFHE